MALATLISNRLYDGTYPVFADQEAEVDIGAEVDAVRPISLVGYADIIWTGSFILTTSESSVSGFYDRRTHKMTADIGWYEIRYLNVVMERRPIDGLRVGLPKVTGASKSASVSYPGDTWVAGNGSPTTLVNIGSDRPYRGDTLRWYIRPNVSGFLALSVVTNFVDNVGDTGRWIINP